MDGKAARKLIFPLYNQLSNQQEVPEGDPFCPAPVFPEDPDEKITVLFRFSLNDFVEIASAIDVGRDIVFGEDAVRIWHLWTYAYMCAQFCDEVAQCLTDENPALIAALAAALANNPTLRAAIGAATAENGGATPGMALTSQQVHQDISPDNVRDEEGNCILDAAWGADLYAVQSGNRAITDFFEILESQSNTLERAQIALDAIPAAGGTVASAPAFADQIAEEIAEGYAAAYTEAFENGLACDIFCVMKINCTLSVDDLVGILQTRLGTIEFNDFQAIMQFVIAGSFSGDQIAEVAFLLYFTALKFGQQFGGVLGIRPLTNILGLGADQLASDNWESLCTCPYSWERIYDFTIDEQGWTPLPATISAIYHPGLGWGRGHSPESVGRISTYVDFGASTDVTFVRLQYAGLSSGGGNLQTATIYKTPPYTAVEGHSFGDDLTYTTPFTSDFMALDTASDTNGTLFPIDGYLYRAVVRGNGTPPA